MTDANYNALVTRLEREARQNPLWYRVRLGLLAALGYAFIAASLALTLALLAGIGAGGYFLVRHARNVSGISQLLRIAVPVTLGLLIFTFVIVRSLWVRVPEPGGVEIERGRAVLLFREIESLREKIGAPHLHRILFTDEFNAGVQQIPRLGLFGWPRNFLVIGLPLLLTLSPDQFRSVLAHELGHVSQAHGKFGHAIYCLRQTWFQLLTALTHQEHAGATPMLWFFGWYAPFFWAYSFALGRAQEYEADRCAARAVGSRDAADALINAELIFHAFERRAVAASAGGTTPAGPPTPIELNQWLNAALSQTDSPDDYHPSLAARLRALGEAPRVPPAHDESAAARFLGPMTPLIARALGMITGPAPSPEERQDVTPGASSQAAPSAPSQTGANHNGGAAPENVLRPLSG